MAIFFLISIKRLKFQVYIKFLNNIPANFSPKGWSEFQITKILAGIWQNPCSEFPYIIVPPK